MSSFHPLTLPHPIPANPHKNQPTHALISKLFDLNQQKQSASSHDSAAHSTSSHNHFLHNRRANFVSQLPHTSSLSQKRHLNTLSWRLFYEKLLNLREYDFESIQDTDLDALKFEFASNLQNHEWRRFQMLHEHMARHCHACSSASQDNPHACKRATYDTFLQLLFNLRDIGQKSTDNRPMSSFQHLTEFRQMASVDGLHRESVPWLETLYTNNQWFVPGQDNLSDITNLGKDTLFSNYVFNQKLNSTPLKEDVRIQHQDLDHDLVQKWFQTGSSSRRQLTDNSSYNDAVPPNPPSHITEPPSFSFFGKALREAHTLMDTSSPFPSQASLLMSLPPLSPAGSTPQEHSLVNHESQSQQPISPLRLSNNIEIAYAPEEPREERVEPPFKKLIVSNSPDSQRFRKRIHNNAPPSSTRGTAPSITPQSTQSAHSDSSFPSSRQQQSPIDHNAQRQRSILYLTELGKDTLDQVYNSYFVHSKNAPYDPITTTEQDLIDDAILVWQGIASETFSFRASKCRFEPIYVRLHSTSVSSIRAVLNDIAWSGSLYKRLEVFCQFFMSPEFHNPATNSIICQAFSNSVFKFLKYYQSCIIKLGTVVKTVLQNEAYSDSDSTKTDITKNTMTLWSISQHVRPLVAKLQFVAQLCHCDLRSEHDLEDNYIEEVQGSFETTMRISGRLFQFPRGAHLLSYLHYMSLTSSEETKPLLLTFFKDASRPYLKWLQDWIYHGTIDENNHEFMVRKTRAFYLNVQQYESATSFWTAAFNLFEDNVPSFLSEVADAILSVGRVLNVIRKYDPTHYILKSRTVSDPKLIIRFYNEEIRRLKADYLKLVIVQKAEHQRHVQQRVEKQMLQLESMKEKSHLLQEKIQKQHNELVELARQQAEDRQRLLEERIAEIQAKRDLQRKELLESEEMEREREVQAEQEQQRLMELAKQRILEEHGVQIRLLEKQRRLIEWKYERQNLNALRQNKLLLVQNQYNQMKLAQELGLSIDQVSMQSPGALTRAASLGDAAQHSSMEKLPLHNDIPRDDTMQDVDESILSNVDAMETDTEATAHNDEHAILVHPEPSRRAHVNIEAAEAHQIISPSNISIDTMDDADNESASFEDDAMHDDENESLEDHAEETAATAVQLLRSPSDNLLPVALRKRKPTPLLSPSKNNSLQLDMEQEYYNLFAQDMDDEFSNGKRTSTAEKNLKLPPIASRSVNFVGMKSDLPIDQSIEESLFKPIIVQYNAAHSIALSVFFGELHLEDHLEVIRKFFLMNAGDFSEIFFRRIIDGLHEGNRWTDTHQLNSVLESTLKLTDYYEEDSLSRNLSFRIPPLDPTKPINIHGIDALKHIALKYNVGWPLNILFDGDSLSKYNQIFHFLAQVKRVMIELNDTWTHFTHRTVRQSFDTRIREIQMFRQEIQHFMNIMQGYLMTEVLETLFSAFTHRIKTEVKTIEKLCYLHQEFLNTAIKRCLLSSAAKPVKNVIDRMFAVILQFRLQILSNPLNLNLPHGAFMMMKQSRYQFRELQMEFIHILKKKDLKEDHTTQLLTTLNYNNHYF